MNLFYSSGDLTSSEFKKNPSQSLGGLITAKKIVSDVAMLFGTVSLHDIEYGQKEYRCVFLKNESLSKELQDIKLWVKKTYQITTVTDPNTLIPSVNDCYLVPSGSIGVWLNKNGYLATWSGTEWVFSLPPLFSFEFAVDTETQLINSTYEQPFGILFTNADSFDEITNLFDVGSLNPLGFTAIWVKRTVIKRLITKYDFYVEGENNEELRIIQSLSLNLSAVEMNSLKMVDSTSAEYFADTDYSIVIPVKINEIGEDNYSALNFGFSFKFNDGIDFTKLSCDAYFSSTTYTDIVNNSSFGSFASTGNFNENLILNITFLDTGVYDLTFTIEDSGNILYTKVYRYIIS